MTGAIAWAVVLAAAFTLEGLALAQVAGWPSFTDLLRPLLREPLGRTLLFTLWVWVGWHILTSG